MSTAKSIRIVCLAALAVVVGVTAAAAQGSKAWVDVNFGAATSKAEEASYALGAPLFGETAGFAVVYPEPSRGGSFDFGGGYMFTPRFGVGASFAGTSHQDVAGLGASVPHPYFFNAFGSTGAETEEELSRTEGAFHVHAMLVPVNGDRVQVRVYGGPTFFRYQADMVSDFRYSQVALPFSLANDVSITQYETTEVDGSGVGYHVGGDVSVFFNRVFGVGAFARFSGGTVTIDEPFTLSEEDIKVGGVQIGGGLRLRF